MYVYLFSVKYIFVIIVNLCDVSVDSRCYMYNLNLVHPIVFIFQEENYFVIVPSTFINFR